MTAVARRARELYKQFLWIGREYPSGIDTVRERVKRAFAKNRDVNDPVELARLYDRAEFVLKEMEAVVKLKKYRTLRRRYVLPEQRRMEEEERLRRIEEAERA